MPPGSMDLISLDVLYSFSKVSSSTSYSRRLTFGIDHADWSSVCFVLCREARKVDLDPFA